MSTLSVPALAGTEHYSTAKTPIRELLADPAAKAVLARHFPEFVNNPSVAQGKADRFTIRFIRKFKPRIFTDARVNAADADLAKLPAR
ncbi:hypothetical protein [Novosphingobium barchaimii]|uniref:hypothetical protein n=1 Tax=Novosphingobium barchaimii TaxID=1420591 RepID=UPI0011DFBDA8|nr:hypothetical protein [Novosphingobium barchaimii]